MSDHQKLFPSGLSPSQLERISECAARAENLSPAQLQEQANHHLQQARLAHQTNRIVNVRLAEAIVGVITRIIDHWNMLPSDHRGWLAFTS